MGTPLEQAIQDRFREVAIMHHLTQGRLLPYGNAGFDKWAWGELNYRPHAYQALNGPGHFQHPTG